MGNQKQQTCRLGSALALGVEVPKSSGPSLSHSVLNLLNAQLLKGSVPGSAWCLSNTARRVHSLSVLLSRPGVPASVQGETLMLPGLLPSWRTPLPKPFSGSFTRHRLRGQ